MEFADEFYVKAAKRFLEIQGYSILEECWASKDDESGFEIIARDNNTLVFVEVNGRDRGDGFLSEVLTQAKRGRFERAATEYLRNQHYEDVPSFAFRFDTIGINMLDETHLAIKHHVNAFGL